VSIRDDPIGFDEKTAATRQLLTARVERLDCDRGRFNATN